MKSIIRTNRAGVFFGEIEKQENTPAGVIVTIKNCRRIWYWEGAASLSEMANKGVRYPSRCKFPAPVASITVRAFIEQTWYDYGRDAIRQLAGHYGIKIER